MCDLPNEVLADALGGVFGENLLITVLSHVNVIKPSALASIDYDTVHVAVITAMGINFPDVIWQLVKKLKDLDCT